MYILTPNMQVCIQEVSISDAVILERHTARDTQRNIIQRSNSGMPASTNVHLSVGKSIIIINLVQQSPQLHVRVKSHSLEI